MEVYIIAGVIVLAIFYLASKTGVNDREDAHPRKFLYSRKEALMTDAETRFFHRLQRVSEGKYYVFPQIHLSALLKNETKGRYWKAAFQRINRTSVDYVLAHKDSLQVAYVVELDDWSHDTAKRRSRDMGVEEMLKSAGIKLVRFRDVANMSDEDIINVFKSTQGVKDEMTAL